MTVFISKSGLRKGVHYRRVAVSPTGVHRATGESLTGTFLQCQPGDFVVEGRREGSHRDLVIYRVTSDGLEAGGTQEALQVITVYDLEEIEP